MCEPCTCPSSPQVSTSCVVVNKNDSVQDVLWLEAVPLHCTVTHEDVQYLDQLTVPTPVTEYDRIRILRQAKILDTTSEEEYDRFTALAARVLKFPIAFVSLVDISRQWFKARVGFDVTETHRDHAFCSYTILESSPEVFIVPDAWEDERFKSNPLVLGAPFSRFYAGTALKVQGVKVGTLCIIDTKPRHDFGSKQRVILTEIAAMISNSIEIRRSKMMQMEVELARISTSILYCIKQPLEVLNRHNNEVFKRWTNVQVPTEVRQVKLLQDDVNVLQDKANILECMIDLTLNVANRLLDMGHSCIKSPRLVVCNLSDVVRKAEAMVSRCNPSCSMDWEQGFHNAHSPTAPDCHPSSQGLYSHPDLLLLIVISLMSSFCNYNHKVESVSIAQEGTKSNAVLTPQQISQLIDKDAFQSSASQSCRQKKREEALLRTNVPQKGFLILSLIAKVQFVPIHPQLRYELLTLQYLAEGVGGTLHEDAIEINGLQHIHIQVRLPSLQLSPIVASLTNKYANEENNILTCEKNFKPFSMKLLFSIFHRSTSVKIYTEDAAIVVPSNHFQEVSVGPHRSIFPIKQIGSLGLTIVQQISFQLTAASIVPTFPSQSTIAVVNGEGVNMLGGSQKVQDLSIYSMVHPFSTTTI